MAAREWLNKAASTLEEVKASNQSWEEKKADLDDKVSKLKRPTNYSLPHDAKHHHQQQQHGFPPSDDPNSTSTASSDDDENDSHDPSSSASLSLGPMSVPVGARLRAAAAHEAQEYSPSTGGGTRRGSSQNHQRQGGGGGGERATPKKQQPNKRGGSILDPAPLLTTNPPKSKQLNSIDGEQATSYKSSSIIDGVFHTITLHQTATHMQIEAVDTLSGAVHTTSTKVSPNQQSLTRKEREAYFENLISRLAFKKDAVSDPSSSAPLLPRYMLSTGGGAALKRLVVLNIDRPLLQPGAPTTADVRRLQGGQGPRDPSPSSGLSQHYASMLSSSTHPSSQRPFYKNHLPVGDVVAHVTATCIPPYRPYSSLGGGLLLTFVADELPSISRVVPIGQPPVVTYFLPRCAVAAVAETGRQGGGGGGGASGLNNPFSPGPKPLHGLKPRKSVLGGDTMLPPPNGESSFLPPPASASVDQAAVSAFLSVANLSRAEVAPSSGAHHPSGQTEVLAPLCVHVPGRLRALIDDCLKREFCATCLQSLARGYICRCSPQHDARVDIIRRRREAVIDIQAGARKRLARRTVTRRKKENSLLLDEQRAEQERIRLQEEEADKARRLQEGIEKTKKDKDEAEKKAKKEKKEAEAKARSTKALKVHGAATAIQSYARVKLAKMKVENKREERRASIKIQSNIRRCQADGRVRCIREERNIERARLLELEKENQRLREREAKAREEAASAKAIVDAAVDAARECLCVQPTRLAIRQAESKLKDAFLKGATEDDQRLEPVVAWILDAEEAEAAREAQEARLKAEEEGRIQLQFELEAKARAEAARREALRLAAIDAAIASFETNSIDEVTGALARAVEAGVSSDDPCMKQVHAWIENAEAEAKARAEEEARRLVAELAEQERLQKLVEEEEARRQAQLRLEALEKVRIEAEVAEKVRIEAELAEQARRAELERLQIEAELAERARLAELERLNILAEHEAIARTKAEAEAKAKAEEEARRLAA